MNHYRTQPGTLAHRAVAELRTHAEPISSAVLAEALDVSTSSIVPCLKAAVEHGVISCQPKGGLLYWGLGDEAPPPNLEDEDMRPPRRSNAAPEVADDVPPTFWRSSQDELIIEAGRQRMRLSGKATKQLRRFLSRVPH